MSGSKKNTIDAILLLSFFVEVTFVSASSSTTQLSLERSMQKQLTYPKYKANTFNDLSLSESARRFSIWRPNRSHIDFRTFAPTKSLAKWQLLNRSCRSWCPFMRHVGFSGKIVSVGLFRGSWYCDRSKNLLLNHTIRGFEPIYSKHMLPKRKLWSGLWCLSLEEDPNRPRCLWKRLTSQIRLLENDRSRLPFGNPGIHSSPIAPWCWTR